MSVNVSFKTFSNIRSYSEIPDIVEVRKNIFVEEQKYDLVDQFNEIDFRCTHIAMIYEGKTIGTSRLYLKNGKTEYLGRLGILKEFRNKGLGIVFMDELKKVAKEVLEWKIIYLDGTSKYHYFYLKIGAVVIGPEFSIEDNPHLPMKIDL